MASRIFAVFSAIGMVAMPALAQQQPDVPLISVIGSGEVEAPPDAFRLSASIEGRGGDQVAALRELASVRTRVSDVERLQGLTRARLTTGAPSVRPTFDPSCGQAGYGRTTDDCPIVGYVAAMALTLEAGPIERAGDALSLASERGARDVQVQDFYLRDDATQKTQARQAAFADARRQAEALAQAANQRIVRLLRLEEPNVRAYGAPPPLLVVGDVAVTGARIQPTVSLDVAPPPVVTTAQVSAVFEIE